MSSRKDKIQREQKDWNTIDQVVDTSGAFIAKNWKWVFGVIGLAIVAIGILVAFRFLVTNPKNNSALNAMVAGQIYMKNGQDSIALYGDSNGWIGFEGVLTEYNATKAAKVARYNAAVCAYNLGEYDKSLKYAKEFKANDILLQYLAKGIAGDCLVNLGKIDEAIPYFIKAGEGLDDPNYSPIMYKKAALAYKSKKDYDKVIEIFSTIQNKYSTMNAMTDSPIVLEAGKYIEEAKILKNQN